MTEALMLFEQISNSRYFEQASLILFLNKMDLFREKLKSGISPISRYFSDYHGANRDVKAGQAFFAEKFKTLLRKKKELYIHFTNATDTNLLKVTMKSVQDMIVQRNLNQLIL
jgi:guanine nucleotide-binding protein subunit alpha, other